MEGAYSPSVFERALEVLHQAVRIDDARCGTGEDAGFGADVGFEGLGFFFGEEVCWYADCLGVGVDFFDGRHLLGVLGDDPFPRFAMGDVVLLA